ncbi:hypothetical protein [Hymenobacter sp. BT491]|uniref:hypothetical protein n=1 Tax=Hymenobacter sp. BT491 TaxID=2766779 RepID=UPI001653CD1E|nr:hypothetical protein [Hymenobacter sp. BT491]MBC6988918.1 hypothetical protein [Hymenobacter sp. BT491]
MKLRDLPKLEPFFYAPLAFIALVVLAFLVATCWRTDDDTGVQMSRKEAKASRKTYERLEKEKEAHKADAATHYNQTRETTPTPVTAATVSWADSVLRANAGR